MIIIRRYGRLVDTTEIETRNWNDLFVKVFFQNEIRLKINIIPYVCHVSFNNKGRDLFMINYTKILDKKNENYDYNFNFIYNLSETEVESDTGEQSEKVFVIGIFICYEGKI